MNVPNMFTRAYCQYEIGKADNGFTFGWYDVASDEFIFKVAKTPDELGDFIMEWQLDRVNGMKKWFSEKSNG